MDLPNNTALHFQNTLGSHTELNFLRDHFLLTVVFLEKSELSSFKRAIFPKAHARPHFHFLSSLYVGRKDFPIPETRGSSKSDFNHCGKEY